DGVGKQRSCKQRIGPGMRILEACKGTVEFCANDPVATKLIIRADLSAPKSSGGNRRRILARSRWLENLHRAPARLSAHIDPGPTESSAARRLPIALRGAIGVGDRAHSRSEHYGTHEHSHDTAPATQTGN